MAIYWLPYIVYWLSYFRKYFITTMAFKNKSIYNSKTGQQINFILTSTDTDGELLEMEATFPQLSKEPPEHYHPNQEEFFHVLSGELTIRLNGQVKTYPTGSLIHVLPGKIHSMWNASCQKAVVNWKVYPAIDTEYLLEVLSGLANDDKTDENGIPTLPAMLFILNRFSDSFRLAKPAFLVQQILFLLISPILLFSNLKKKTDRYIN